MLTNHTKGILNQVINKPPAPTITASKLQLQLPNQKTAITTEPIYDTYNGEPIVIPTKNMVTILSNPTPATFKIKWFNPTTMKFVRAIATAQQLGLSLFATNKHPDTTPLEPDQDEPKTLRIYQEYGATFLLYKLRACLADAPGVGKTLQALVASYRACMAYQLGVDPLNLCYPINLNNLHDDKNTHPTTRPLWAKPKSSHTSQTYSFQGSRTTITVSEKQPYYWSPDTNPVVIIVAPTHLCKMWFNEIRLQFPNEHVAMATHDTQNNRMAVLEPGCRFYIVNYEMMRKAKPPTDEDYETVLVPFQVPGQSYTINIEERRLKASYVQPRTYLDALADLHLLCVIFDESHRLKSAKSKQAKAAAEFSFKSPYRFLLSATPIKREADDLFWQFHIMDPDRFLADEPAKFLREYCLYDVNEYGKRNIRLRDSAKRRFWFNRITSLETALTDYTAMFGQQTAKESKKYKASFTDPNLNGYILGRSYYDVGLYLPPVIPATIPVNMDTVIRNVYEGLKKTYKANFELLGESITVDSLMGMLHSLRILTACPNKFEAVKQIMEDNDGPYVIFCEYKDAGMALAHDLGTTFISGEIPDNERESLISSLLKEEKPIVGMGRVIGTGINALADCNVIINFEHDYTPGERTQRIGRVQRYSPNREEGQPVLLFDVVVVDSIDEQVLATQKNRGLSIKDIITVELGV